jgi:hypothetical protein
VNRDLINYYLDVVQELIDRAVPATLDNINKHLAPANKEHEVVEALTTLVAEGRLVRSTVSAPVGGSVEPEQYVLPRR